VFYREVLSLYRAYDRGESNPLKPLRIQYKDFAVWQNRQRFEREERYWVGKLAGAPERLALPYDFAPREEQNFEGDHQTLGLGPEILQDFRNIAAKCSTTVSNVVLATFNLLLFKISKQDDLCVGMSIANRNHPDLENILGFFVNILPIRTRFSGEMEFEALLRQVTQSTSEAFENQDYPFDMLVRKINPRRMSNRQPILNVIYGFQNYLDVNLDIGFHTGAVPLRLFDGNGGLEQAQSFDLSFKTSKFDLTLFVFEQDKGLNLTLEFDTALFRPESIRRYLSVFGRLARMVCKEGVR
jgi:non-ribosomal peptide synthetase component F